MANLVENSTLNDGWVAMNRESQSSNSGHTATDCVFWNVRGSKGTSEDFLSSGNPDHFSYPGFSMLRSYQVGMGYVIGTKDMYVLTGLADDYVDVEALETVFEQGIDAILTNISVWINTLSNLI